MSTVAQAAADKAARAEVTHAAAQKMKTLWPARIQPWPKCRGTEGECNSGQPPGRDGFCSVCHKRVVTLIVRGYDVHPLPVLRVSYATYRAKTPQSAPKPNRKPMAAPVFTEGDTGGFPTPEQARAKAPVVAPPADTAPMFGPKWAAPLTQMEQVSIGGAPGLPLMSFPRVDPPAATKPAPPAEPWSVDGAREGLLEAVDALRLEVASLRAQLRDPVVLRAALARTDAKAAEIATLKARIAKLENE